MKIGIVQLVFATMLSLAIITEKALKMQNETLWIAEIMDWLLVLTGLINLSIERKMREPKS